jgi:hypothetical protein
MLRIPADNTWITFDKTQYFIPSDWEGECDIVSDCGWWRGKVCIVKTSAGRFVKWIQCYSLKFE